MGLRGRFIVQRVIWPRLHAVPGLGAWLAARQDHTGPRPEKPRSRTAGAAVAGGLAGSSATVLVAVLVAHGGTMSTLASSPVPGGTLTSSAATTPVTSGGSTSATARGRSSRPTLAPAQTPAGAGPQRHTTGGSRPQTASEHSTGCAQSAAGCGGSGPHQSHPAPGSHTSAPAPTHPVSTVSPSGHKKSHHPGSRCVRPLIQTGSRCPPGSPPEPGPASGPAGGHHFGHRTGSRGPAPVASTPARPADPAGTTPVTISD